MARSAIATDPFTGYTNGAFPTSNWTNLDGNNGELRIIASGQIGSTYSAFSTMRRSAGTYSADQYAGVTLQGITGTLTGTRIGVAMRCSADASPNDDSYLVYFDDGQTTGTRSVYVDRMVNGARTNLALDTAETWASGDVLWCEVTGTGATVTLNCFRNAGAIAALTGIADTNAARITAAGSPGMMAYLASTVYVSAWEGGDVTAGSSNAPRASYYNMMRNS